MEIGWDLTQNINWNNEKVENKINIKWNLVEKVGKGGSRDELDEKVGKRVDGYVFGVILVFVWRYFLVLFPTLRKKTHPTDPLQIAVRSRVGRLKKGGKTIHSEQKGVPKVTDVLIDFLLIF